MALSGGSADEVFGGCPQFFDEDADVLRPGLSAYAADGYRDVVAGIRHLHLTRFVRILLHRKVRVPFGDHDHRLVKCVYNTPWALRPFGGGEMSPLHEATADMLSKSVYDRVGSPCPPTRDPKYATALQDRTRDLLTRTGRPVFGPVAPGRLGRAAEREAPMSGQVDRRSLERTLALALRPDLHEPENDLS